MNQSFGDLNYKNHSGVAFDIQTQIKGNWKPSPRHILWRNSKTATAARQRFKLVSYCCGAAYTAKQLLPHHSLLFATLERVPNIF